MYIVYNIDIDHDNEEYIYIPLMISKGCEIDDKKISTDHKSLILLLTEIKELAHTIQQAKGLNCTTAIASFKTKVPAFVKKLNGERVIVFRDYSCEEERGCYSIPFQVHLWFSHIISVNVLSLFLP